MIGFWILVICKNGYNKSDIDYQVYKKKIMSIASKYNCDFFETQEEGYKTYNLKIDNYSDIEISFKKKMSNNFLEDLFWIERFDVRYVINNKNKTKYNVSLFTDLVNEFSGKKIGYVSCKEFLEADESKYKVSAYGFTKNEDELIHKLEYLNFFEDWMIEYVLYSDDHEELYFWGRT